MIGRRSQCKRPLLVSEVTEALPSDLLEEVLTKVPKASLLSFRLVSRHWRLVIIPNAVRRTGCKFPPALLYFSLALGQEHSVQMYNNWRTKRTLNFADHVEPDPNGENVFPSIVASEGGLLFFSTEGIRPASTQAEGIIVYNPLTSQHKRITFPDRSGEDHDRFQCDLPVAVVTDARTNSYKLIIARRHSYENDWPTTFVYNSITSSWKTTYIPTGTCPDGTSIPAHEKLKVKASTVFRFHKRSVCLNGNVYWLTKYVKTVSTLDMILHEELLKYDTENERWSSQQLSFDDDCLRQDCTGYHGQEFVDDFQIVPYKGKVLLMHMPGQTHWECPRRIANVTSICEQFDSEFSSRLSQEKAESLAYALERNLPLFPIRARANLANKFFRHPYFYLGNEDLLYYVVGGLKFVGDKLLREQRIIVYDSLEGSLGSFTYLPFVLEDLDRHAASYTCEKTLWCFSPSLISLV